MRTRLDIYKEHRKRLVSDRVPKAKLLKNLRDEWFEVKSEVDALTTLINTLDVLIKKEAKRMPASDILRIGESENQFLLYGDFSDREPGKK